MKDNFSLQAASYAKYRPGYPGELFDFILDQVKERKAVWDCATGNGQTAKLLAPFFEKVFATDISVKQLENAVRASNIIYSLQPAEQTDFEGNTFDLVTVSQALHWFNFEAFYSEVKRVTRPGGWIAVWMYGRHAISPSIEELVQNFHDITLGEYWDEERKHVMSNYSSIPFPFREINCPAFEMTCMWSLSDFTGYLQTWSALQKFIAINSYNPLEELIPRIQKHWEKDKMKVRFPIHLRMGQVVK